MFERCKDETECKKLFKRLAKYLHPDMGGESELFILLQEEYDFVLAFINFRDPRQEREENFKPKKSYKGDPLKYQTTHENVQAGSGCLEVIEEILKYAEQHKKFDPSFTESVQEFLMENGYITSHQYNRLVNIYYSFQMHRTKS